MIGRRGSTLGRTEPVAGQHDSAHEHQKLPAAGSANRRDHRRRGLPPGSRGERCRRCWIRHGLARPVDDHGVAPGVTGHRAVSCGPPLRVSHGPLHRHHRTSCQRSSSLNLTGKPNVVRKSTAEATLAPGAAAGSSGRGGRLSDSLSGDHPHRRSAPPARSRPSTNTERSSAAPQNRLSPGDSGLLALMSNDPRSLRAQATDTFARWRSPTSTTIATGMRPRVAMSFSAGGGLVRIFSAHRGDRG